ncbi:MAG: SpoIID/LytB domain-containing protein [Actinomycetota bacterium]
MTVRGRPLPVVGAVLTVLAMLILVVAAPVAGPSAKDRADAMTAAPTMELAGRGWGHGRGMSQYGALGYARDFGWSSAQILDHYYGGTSAGTAPRPGAVDPDNLRVDLVYLRGRATTVALDAGNLEVLAPDGTVLHTATGAVRLTAQSGGLQLAVGSGCDGGFADIALLGHTTVRVRATGNPADQSGLLQACGPSYRTWYDGEIWAIATSSGQRTVNLVTVEGYLRGVVPNEVPALWPTETLQAQAVAARSYVLAGDTRWSGYADTCDSTLCQVYDGRYTTRGGLRSATHARTDAAIAATTDVVRLRGNGTVARTEFSSSSGGHTVDGDFPAVVDLGDAVTSNPNHTWTAVVDLTSYEDEVDLGPLLGAAVVTRDGNGAWGGRVEQARFYFEDGVTTLTGDQVRRRFGLKSNWFRFGPVERSGNAASGVDLESATRFVDEAFRRLAGRTPNQAEIDRWVRALRVGNRQTLTDQLAGGEHFAGVLVDDLYRIAFGRSSDPDGRRYWMDEMASGLKYEHLGTLFYGSAEYVLRSGATDAAFVDTLYRDVLGREADAGGRQYWLRQLADGLATPPDVANSFFVSIESRRDRADAMYLRVLGTAAGPDLVDRHAARLLEVDDLTLAAELATELGGGDG